MKFIVASVFVALATIAYAMPQDTYSTKYDHIDIDEVIENERLFNNYVACVDGSGKCTEEGEELKKNYKDAIVTCCAKCSEKQKTAAEKVYKHLEQNQPKKLAELKAKLDPTGEYEEKCRKQYGF